MSETTIASTAELCNGGFSALLDSNALRSQADKAELAETVEEERARFRIWAGQIGTFAKHHASLDYRLRESETVRSLVLSQLVILREAELRLLGLLHPDELNAHVDEPSSQDDGFERSEFTSSDTESSASFDVPTEEECVISIRSAIDRLNRLAKAIRQPGISSQTFKADHFEPKDEFGNNEIHAFEKYNLELIQILCDNAPEYLIQRLSKVNSSRRRLFLYRRKHQNVLHGEENSTPKRRLSSSQNNTQRTYSVLPDMEMNPTSVVSECPTRNNPDHGPQSSIAKATSFVESQFRQSNSSKAASSVGGTSVASKFSHSRLPPPPKFPKTRDHFECPYCCLLIPTTALGRSSWRQHLMKDLEPYVCVFENCPQPEAKYRDQSTWATHLRSHVVRWSCRLPGHERGFDTMTFTCGNEYASHLKGHNNHGKQFSDAEIELLKQQSRRPDPVPIKSCQLCGVSMEDLARKFTSLTQYPSRGGMETPSSVSLALEMQKHVALHLMTIASYSLPWLNDANSDVASDRPLSFTSGVTSDGLTEPGGQHDLREIHRDLSEEFGDLNFEDHDHKPEEYVQDEWNFIEEIPYDGQKFDEVLSTFVRKFHIDMAFTGSAKREPLLPCTYMPMERNTDFFGREDALQFIQSQLCCTPPAASETSQPNSILRTCSLYGPAGIGKTQVAAEFVYRHMQEFDAVFWVHADEGSKLIEDFNKISVQIGLVDGGSADSEDQALTRDLFKRWLGDPIKPSKLGQDSERASWLLVLDHVIDPAVLEQFWPVERIYGSILITSRRPMPWSPERYPSWTLDRFTPLEGASFMCSLLKSEVTADEKQCATLISSKVKGIPYALGHLTKWIVGEGLNFSEFLAQNHTRENQKLQEKMKGELARFVVAEEHSFLEAAFESLKHSRQLLDVLSMLDPDNISERILETDSPHLFIKGYPTTQSSLREALEELLKYSLVIRSPTSTTYTVHRIVQDAVRKQMSPIYSRDVYNTCVLLVNAQWPFHTFDWRHGISRWPQCEELFPHTIRLRRLAPNVRTDEYHLYGAFLCARLWCDCGWYCHERGRTTESDDFSSVAQYLCGKLKTFYPLLPAQQQPHLPDERDIDNILAEIHHNRGVIANEINRPAESLEYLSKFNSMMVRDLGDKESGTDMRLALSFNELGCAYMLRNDYPRAEECFEKSISSMEKLDNYERWQVSLPGVNLGVVYWLTNRYTEALDVLSQGLRDREKKFGFNDQESFITGRFLYTLGNVHESLNNYDTSLEYHQRSLNHYRNTLGSAHHRTADAFVRITRHFMRLDRLAEALVLVDKAIHIYHNYDSAFEAETARAKFYKSKVLRQSGDIAEADRELTESVNWYYELNHDANERREIDEADFDRIIVFWSR